MSSVKIIRLPRGKSAFKKGKAGKIQKKKLRKKKRFPGFYASRKWRRLRQIIHILWDGPCMKCDRRVTRMNVDHIKPKSKFRSLQYELENLQVLCKTCNFKKSNIDETDYRPENFILRVRGYKRNVMKKEVLYL